MTIFWLSVPAKPQPFLRYTLSDSNGATDTANVTLQVRGTGTFTSPSQSDSEGAVLGFNGQPVSLTVDAPSETTTSTANLGLVIGLGPVLQPQMNIVYLIDISGSTSDAFDGTPVGDLNGDGTSNTVLDAEIAGLIALTDRVRGLGFSSADVSITVIPFNGAADPANVDGWRRRECGDIQSRPDRRCCDRKLPERSGCRRANEFRQCPESGQ